MLDSCPQSGEVPYMPAKKKPAAKKAASKAMPAKKPAGKKK
jgi:hypothetical protein